MPKPLKVQLALQGGGAKIVGLIAVTRLAGTSAGAVAATLFAAKAPMGELRVSLCEGVIKNLLENYKKIPIRSAATALAAGQTVWDTTQIRDFLRGEFAKHGKKYLKDLNPKVMVISADVANSQKHTHGPNESIVDALMCSTGIPFAFRLWKSHAPPNGGLITFRAIANSLRLLKTFFTANENGKTTKKDESQKSAEDREDPILVDGGVCENLPVDELLEDEEVHGPVVAITFGKSVYCRPNNLLNFSMALMDTAIANSVNRARVRIPSSAVFEIGDTFPISTFDFEQAIEVAGQRANPDGAYSKVKSAAKEFFTGYINRRRQGNPVTNYDPWASRNSAADKVMFAGWDMCSCLSQAKVRYESVRIEAVIHNGARPDESHVCTKFHVLEEPVHCFKVSVMNSVDREYLGRTYWTVTKPDKTEIKTFAVPIKNPRHPGERWVAIYFNPPLPARSGPYEMCVSDYLDTVLEKLGGTGVDEWGFESSRAHGVAERMEIIVVHPKTMKLSVDLQATMKCDQSRGLLDFERRSYLARGTVDEYEVSGIVASNVADANGTIDIKLS